MKRTQILISEEQHRLLKDIAREKNISIGARGKKYLCMTFDDSGGSSNHHPLHNPTIEK